MEMKARNIISLNSDPNSETSIFLQPEDRISRNDDDVSQNMFIDGKEYLSSNLQSGENIERKEIDNTKDESGSKTSFCGRYSGILLSLLSALIFPLGALAVKYMEGYHPFTLSVYRFQGILLLSIPLLPYAEFVQKKQVLQSIWPLTESSKRKIFILLIIRGLIGTLVTVLYFYSLIYLTIADAMIIGSIKPVLVTLVAHIILGEKFGIFPICVAVLTILGVGVILRPPILTGREEFDQDLLIGALYAFGSLLAVTFSIIIMRYVRRIHISLVHFTFGSSGTIMTLILSLSFGVFKLPHDTKDILYAIAIAAVAFIVQTLGMFSLKKEQAGIVTLVRVTEIVFAMFWQFIFLGVIPDIFSLVGAAIVLLGVTLTGWSKWLSTLAEDHPSRKKYSFALK